ncbi:hypothetical protein G7087_05450 [Rubrivivax benzoatilyticus]|uniref:Cache domain-containing protein n=1 Tax=Rubrivivax benzoatilyticus TaxID=316997 RepID=A0ABX0HU36_9BURK|nr:MULTISPECIES: hypothetical protein [Rubrivivax]MCC9595607.1 hypothetical protein [Rubrivivax sp. JA1055]MCD0420707.1 hypothetical protein [Rubrivivax sp. JA1024]EGJ10969.1 hypothetical protein RBXJA2T_11608 [Rubrivivax benzoatilyticus JA2 = ATCC BAA-35]MCC9646886.1 hypothetical protein [Rubrivivax sp. JA1029]NHK97816.1 hypothetical protein [Rubrivivax benzoatilyticus]
MHRFRPARRLVITAALLACGTGFVAAAELPADVQAKVERAKKRLVEMAADPVVIATVREANTRDASGMNNGKWVDLPDSDPLVKAMLGGKASQLIVKWEQADPTINKILLRDQKGNIVAGSTKPLIYNNATRPVFANALKGQPWAADEIKPDTTTQIPSVHVSAPVLDGGKPIGVIHAGLTAK